MDITELYSLVMWITGFGNYYYYVA